MDDGTGHDHRHAGDDGARHEHGAHGDDTLLADSAPHLLPHLRPGQRLLDAGCGRGALTLALADRVAPGPVVGVDASAEAVAAAREAAAARRAARGVHPRRPEAAFHVAGVYDLPYDDASFDVVHTHQMTHHLDDPVRGLREMLRVCAPGGLVAMREVDYGAMVWAPEDPLLDRWRDLFAGAVRAGGGDPFGGRRLRRWARAAGFDDAALTLTSSTWTYATPEATRRWGDAQAERVLGPSFGEIARARGLDAADLDDVARAWQRWGRHPDAWCTVVHGELLVRVPGA